MDSFISDLTGLIPADLDILSVLVFALALGIGILILGGLIRLILGKRSDLNHALSSAIGILFIYVVSVLVYTLAPSGFHRFLSPLPYISISGDHLSLYPILGSSLPSVSDQVLSMVILAFLVNLLDTWIPKGEKLIGWFFLRFLTVLLSMLLHACVDWALNAFLPGIVTTYAPMILLGILVFLLTLGLLKFLLGVVLTIANPVIGAIYAFFFSNHIGKQISKAVMTTTVLTVLVIALQHFGITGISIAAGVLLSYLPLVLVLLVLWYLVAHVM